MTQIEQRALPDPLCGRCRYCVRGIGGLICPECGSDLRQVGIITGPSRLPFWYWIQIGLWTLLLPVAAILLSSFLLRTIVPFGQTTRVNRALFLQAPNYLSGIVLVTGLSRPWRPAIMDPNPAPPVELELKDVTRSSVLHINLASGAYRYQTNTGSIIQRGRGFDGQVLADWLATGGSVNAADPRVLCLCDSACSAVAAVSKNPPIANQFTPLLDEWGQQAGIAHPANFWTSCDPHPAMLVIFGLFWLTVWICGVRHISRRNLPFSHRGHAVYCAIHGNK